MSTSKIHPSAIVDPQAEVADGVEIGPYCIVGPRAVIGAQNKLQSHVVLDGSVTLGPGNFIGHGTVIGAAPQDLSFDSKTESGVEIGRNNVLREYCTIHRGTAPGTATRIGNGNFLMVGVHLGHNCVLGNKVIIANNCLLGGYVSVDDAAFLGGGCTFHQFMRIGRLVMTQGASAFGKDLPPFVMAAERNGVFGLNVIGLRRAGIGADDRAQIKSAFNLIYLSGLNLSQALEKADTLDVKGAAREFIDFIIAARKKRGICPYKGGKPATDEESSGS